MSAQVLSITAATPADIDAIMGCERQPGYEDTVGRWSREQHLAGMADATHRYVVARDGQGVVAGFVMLQHIDRPADAVLIRRIAIMTPGRGHGWDLLSHALAIIFEELGAKRGWLRVWPHNARAIALYSKLGMREDGVSEVERNGASAVMTIMSIDADSYRARKQWSASP